MEPACIFFGNGRQELANNFGDVKRRVILGVPLFDLR
jgi:hypothetical protein